MEDKKYGTQKKEFPDFSVSMCVYGGDHPEWFRTAVDSILNQSCPPSEVVLVVDGPVKLELESVIRQYEANPIFHVIRFKENKGHGEARRAGLSACACSLVAIMDADDICMPDRFQKQLKLFLDQPELDITGGNITEFVDRPENMVGERIVPQTDEKIKNYMRIRCPMNLVTVMFRKDSVEAAGGFLDWYCEEDYYLWARMILKHMKFANLPDILVNVRVGKEMYRRRGGIKYFKSEAKFQKYMLDKKLIGIGTYCVNVIKRMIVQIILPAGMRGWVFRVFARSHKNGVCDERK